MAGQALALKQDMSLQQLGDVFVKSGFFTDTRDAAQAVVKILAGRELGFGPMAAMTGVYIVKGRVSVSANLMAAAVKRTGKYNYRVTEHNEKACEIAFYEDGKDIGHSRFTLEDAKKAGTQNMDKYPRNMLFARAMSNGVKWYCADVFGGPIYTPEEMGAKVNEDGDVVEMPAEPVVKPNGHAAPAPEPVHTNGNGQSKIWKRWQETVAEAAAFGITTPALDPAADDSEVIKAGKALRLAIDALKEEELNSVDLEAAR